MLKGTVLTPKPALEFNIPGWNSVVKSKQTAKEAFWL